MKAWTITEARANISEVFEAALRKGPQKIERRNSEPVVVIPESVWERLAAENPTFAEDALSAAIDDEDWPDRAWLQREARSAGVSVEEYVRSLIREKRRQDQLRERPSEAFRRHFGPEHGVDLPARPAVAYRPVILGSEGDV